MIVFDLKCGHGHIFEAWFGCADDFQTQRERDLSAGPICGDGEIERVPSALAIGGKSTAPAAPQTELSQPDAAAASSGAVGEPGAQIAKAKAMLEAMAKAQAEAVAKSDYVGGKFAEEARAMYYGEQAHRPIWGETEAREARELHEEGVPAMPLLFPVRRESDA